MKTFTLFTAGDLLQPGRWFQYQNQIFEVTAWAAQEPLRVEARLDGTPDLRMFTLLELFDPAGPALFAATRCELLSQLEVTEGGHPQVVDAATLPTHLLTRADHIIQTVEAVQAAIESSQRGHQQQAAPFSLTQATREACQALPMPVSLSGYYAYRALYQTQRGDRALIAAALRRSTYNKTRLDPNAQHFMDTLIQRFYRSNPPLRAKTVYDLARQLWQHNRGWWVNFQKIDPANRDRLIDLLLDGHHPIDAVLADAQHAPDLAQIPLPSQAWFYSYVKWFSTQPGEGSQVYITRHGQAEWDANFLLFDQFAQTATLPLQHVFADHYRLDVLHVDDEFREALGRLWLTLLIDAYSRAPLGLFLGYEDPCIESIQGALRHAIWPKTNLADFGIDRAWSCFGIPQQLSLDNAWAHHSYSLEDLARALAGGGRYTQMNLVFRPPYQARYGGLIERLFGNLSGRLRELLPGAILQAHQRHWHNASQGACLLYRDVVRLIQQLVVDYLHTPHRELKGMTPHEKWMSGMQLMTPVPPALTPQLERCFWRLHPETRTAHRTGLALFGLHYWDSKLTGLRSLDRQGGQRHFGLRYDPADISRVAIFENGQWVGDGFARELRLPDGHYEPVSLWELNLAKDLTRLPGPGRAPRSQSWLRHVLEARELVAQRQTEQKVIRRKLQQMKERRRGRPPALTETQRQALEADQIKETQQVMNGDWTHAADPRAHLFNTLNEVL